MTTINYNTIEALIDECQALEKGGIPACETFLDENGYWRVSGHWTGTLDQMREAMGLADEPVADITITCLSLGRNYGPTPLLNDEEAINLLAALFPRGNPYGGWYSWALLAECLREYIDSDGAWTRPIPEYTPVERVSPLSAEERAAIAARRREAAAAAAATVQRPGVNA